MERTESSPEGGDGGERNFFRRGGCRRMRRQRCGWRKWRRFNEREREANRPYGVPARTQRSGSSGERRKEWSERSPRRKAGTEKSGISSDAVEALL